ncbi:hypothetical protein CEXT_793531 [Caerostris extrusa]|uniref:Uncharacterized protein n=1 Tax=Caerostris extrusa TaxID=172846 RepID=A0AAV4SVC1_CAEEX|nr:hypothetical protein CEXT_793531 [Caerostris extrusa]
MLNLNKCPARPSYSVTNQKAATACHRAVGNYKRDSLQLFFLYFVSLLNRKPLCMRSFEGLGLNPLLASLVIVFDKEKTRWGMCQRLVTKIRATKRDILSCKASKCGTYILRSLPYNNDGLILVYISSAGHALKYNSGAAPLIVKNY